MRQFLGLDRKLMLEWLDATAGLYQENAQPAVIVDRLDHLLAAHVAGAEARQKTTIVLQRIWVRVPEKDRALRDEALQLITAVHPEERIWLHWGLALLAYPFFRDVAAIVGQLSRLQGTFSLAQIERRMIEQWGQRSTLPRAVQRLVRSFIDWHVLSETSIRGSYTSASPRHTDNVELALWLLHCALRAHEAEQVSLAELGQLTYTFPFDLASFARDVHRSRRFQVSLQGLDLAMVAPQY